MFVTVEAKQRKLEDNKDSYDIKSSEDSTGCAQKYLELFPLWLNISRRCLWTDSS